jgi:hypothetical protein
MSCFFRVADQANYSKKNAMISLITKYLIMKGGEHSLIEAINLVAPMMGTFLHMLDIMKSSGLIEELFAE